MDFKTIIAIIIAGLVTENVVLVQSWGICSFLGVSKKVSSAWGMGVAVTFVLVLSSLVGYLLYHGVLVKLEAEYLSIVIYVLLIAAIVQSLDIVLKKVSPNLYHSLGMYLPLITTNCVILLIVNQVADVSFDANGVLTIVIKAIATGVGYLVAIIMMAGVREKLDYGNSQVPKYFKSFPITLITAGIMAMAFAGIAGLAF